MATNNTYASMGPYRPTRTGINATSGSGILDDITSAVEAGGFDANALAPTVPTDLQPGQQIGASPLSAVLPNATALMRGEIPQDVQDQLERISAERGIRSGVGSGGRSQNLTARDLGRTSLDLMAQGVQLASAASQDEQSRAQFGETQRQFNTRYNQWKDSFAAEQNQWKTGVQLQVAQMEEASNQWAQTFAASNNMNSAQLALQGQRMIQQNEQFAQGLVTDLLQANSQRRIMGVQEAINSIMGEGSSDPGFGFETNDAIKDLIESLRFELG